MSCLSRWKYWIRPLLISLYFILMLIALPLTVWELNEQGAKSYVQAWFVGGLFVMMALPVSLWGILQHLVNYTQPDLQRHIIRILWMVPIYALNAWFALRFTGAAIYLDTLRECYEAYVIYNFMSYLLRYLDIEYPHLDIVLENKPQQKHLIPFCCFPPWPMGPHFIQRCKFGVLQYTVIRPTTTIIALICQFADAYDEGEFNFTSAWSYLVIMNNISQIWALYCLVLFYKGTRDELKPINPVPKFLCVKAVVFLSFWQSVFIAFLVAVGWIADGKTWVFGVKQTARGLQDFLICIEMFLAAIAHYFSFSHKQFMDLAAEQRGFWASFVAMWDVSDVRDDVFEHVRVIGKKVKGTVGNQRSSSEGERTPLLRDSKQPALNIQDSVVMTPESVLSPPHTPPEHITSADVHQAFSPLPRDDAKASISDWDFSGDHSDGYYRSDITASMNNYAKFNYSADFGDEINSSECTKKHPPKLNDPSDIRGDTDKSSDLLQCSAEPFSSKSSEDTCKLTAADMLNSDSLLTNVTSSDISLLSDPEDHNVSVSASMNNYAAFSTSEEEESKPKGRTQPATGSSDISILSEISQTNSISGSMNNYAVFSTSAEASSLKSSTTLAATQSSNSGNESNGISKGQHKRMQHNSDHNQNNPIV